MQKLYELTTPYYYDWLRLNLLPNLPKTATKFNFVKHGGPFNDLKFIATCIAVYYGLVFLHYQWRGLFEGFNRIFGWLVQAVFIIHNIVLTLGSALLLALIVENVWERFVQNGLMWSICHPQMYEGDHRLEFFLYLNYLFKYYELLDTVLLMLKGKKLDFLHWYHHSATLFLCYTQLIGRTSASWIPVVLNLTVHVIMYYYYAKTAISKKPVWWKKHLTTMQITQFILDLFFIAVAFYVVILEKHGKQLNKMLGFKLPYLTWGFLGRGIGPTNINYSDRATCHGTFESGVYGVAILSSYLLLFVQFFIKTYTAKKAATSKGKKKQ